MYREQIENNCTSIANPVTSVSLKEEHTVDRHYPCCKHYENIRNTMAEIENLFPAVSRIINPLMMSQDKFWEDDPTTAERMEQFLNSSFVVIHNLSKSTKHRDKFRTPEMRKILDIYKGSPSPKRRLFSLLTISYMADPTIDMTLLADKYDVISDLTGHLDETLIPGNSTVFSIQELVEGLANLAVHPINKDKIIEKSMPLLCTILKRNINVKLSFYVRQVLDEWGFSDVECPSDAEQYEGETETKNKTNESANNTQMLDNLHCVLSKCESFGTNEVMEIVGAVKDIICYKTYERQIILKYMTKHEWPDLLVRIIADVWIPNSKVYTDELLWSILTNTMDILITYSDGDIKFADVLIEHGALDMMHQIANAYYQHLKQKNVAIVDKIGEYRGENVPNEQPGADDNESVNIAKPKQHDFSTPAVAEFGTSGDIHCDQDDTDSKLISRSENSREKDTTNSVASYTLKPVSKNACVNDDATIAYRQNIYVSYRAVFVSNEPIETSKLFELNIDKITEKRITSMVFGVSLYSTFPDDTFYDGDGLGEGSGFWFLRENMLWKDFAIIGGGYKLNLHSIHVNDKVGLVKHPDGTMGFLYNGQYKGIAFRNVPEGVYALVATTGRCVQVSITGDAGTTIQQESPASIPSEPFESFSVNTVGTNPMSCSRMRAPYGFDFSVEERHPKMKQMYQQQNDTIKGVFEKLEHVLDPLLEVNQRKSKGYVNEIDLRTTYSFAVGLYNLHNDPATCVDPISNNLMPFITNNVLMHGETMEKFQINNVSQTHTLPKRLQEVFDAVRPCFDNIQDTSGMVWTGSTSEGFAIADNSSSDTPYVDDEMDLMIPLAMATEDSQIKICKDFKIPKQIISGTANEIGDINTAFLVTELENIGKCQQCQEYPSFMWRPSSYPGYVIVVIPESLQSYTSDGFMKHLCAKSTSSSGRIDMLLMRSTLLAIQEKYTRGRLPIVQYNISRARQEEEGHFKGQLRLVQEGPVQTISVRYELQEAGGSVLEFDQTVDVAIALNGMNWPSIANPWISRKRHWPQNTIVDKIVKDGYHIVPKYFPGGSGIDLEWRLSFSVAERTLAHTFTDNQRICFLVFKKLWRKYLKEPKGLSSYHMKTTMFWLCERTASDDWMESHIGERFLDLQNFLIHFLQISNVPNYFIPENNMISHVDPADVKIILAKAQDVRHRQQYYLEDLVTYSSSFKFT